MKRIVLILAVVIGSLGFKATAFDLKGLLGNAGNTVTDIVDGLLTKSDITVAEMAGTWTAEGPAVTFQSENYLKKAGGAAVAGTIEDKLAPYYKQYGLTGSEMIIETDGSYVLKVKGVSLKGTITKNDDGTFEFSFTPFGSVKLGSIKAYVEKPLSGLNIMFDATKLKNILSAVAGFTNNTLATTAASVLDSYDGLCVGFAYTGTGTGSGNGIFRNNDNTSPATNQTDTTNQSDTLNNVTNALRNLFGK